MFTKYCTFIKFCPGFEKIERKTESQKLFEMDKKKMWKCIQERSQLNMCIHLKWAESDHIIVELGIITHSQLLLTNFL